MSAKSGGEIADLYEGYRASRETLHVTEDTRKSLADYIVASKYARFDSTGHLEDWSAIVDRTHLMYHNQVMKKVHPNVDISDSRIAQSVSVVPRYRLDPGSTQKKTDETEAELSARTTAIAREEKKSLLSDLFEAMALVKSRVILPSMRALQFSGKAAESQNARMFNCSFTVLRNHQDFSDAFYLLLCGCGVGYSVSRIHLDAMGDMTAIVPTKGFDLVRTLVVEDTIEGWRDAILALMSSYFSGSYYQEFDFSKIRPRGAPLVTSGGVAPGPEPLMNAISKIRLVLDGHVFSQNPGSLPSAVRMTSFVAHRIMCLLAEAVLSGGIRRSSLICLFDYDDEQMMDCKKGLNWPKNFPELAMANNSVILRRDRLSEYDYDTIVEAMELWGEPGIFIAEDEWHGTNPCAEIGLYSRFADSKVNGQDVVKDGAKASTKAGLGPEFGFGFCNLTEVNVALVRSMSYDEINFSRILRNAVRHAAILGTIQASFTDFRGEIGNHQVVRDGLLGVGLTGIADASDYLKPEVMRHSARIAVSANAGAAKILGIPRARRVTCVKPSGTASLVLGSVGSGIHPHHAKNYIRRVTASPNEAVARKFREVNPGHVEEKPNGDWVLMFPISSEVPFRPKVDDRDYYAPDVVMTRQILSVKDMLDLVERVFKNWILPGTLGVSDINPPKLPENMITHNVSCTIDVDAQKNEWKYVRDYLKSKLVSGMPSHSLPFRSVSFLSSVGDKMYPYAPRESMETDEEIAYFKRLARKMNPVDYSSITPLDGILDAGSACEGPSCELPTMPRQLDLSFEPILEAEHPFMPENPVVQGRLIIPDDLIDKEASERGEASVLDQNSILLEMKQVLSEMKEVLKDMRKS
jgi:ribonucleoside-triphosphate reductase